MRQHARAKKRLNKLLPSSMLPIIPPAPLLKPILSETLFRRTQKLGTSRIIRQDEEGGHYAQDCDGAFDYEEPAEPFEIAGPVDGRHAECDGASECAGEVAEGDDEGDADGALVVPVPDCYEVDDAWEETCLELYNISCIVPPLIDLHVMIA